LLDEEIRKLKLLNEETEKLKQETNRIGNAVWSLIDTFGGIADRVDQIETEVSGAKKQLTDIEIKVKEMKKELIYTLDQLNGILPEKRKEDLKS
jgi:predicted  nucleic acid-binding Zn-ribbon protein